MKLTYLEILRMARDHAFDNFVLYNERYEDSNFTDNVLGELRDAYMEKFDELMELIEKEKNA